jgi:hypothetical protein
MKLEEFGSRAVLRTAAVGLIGAFALSVASAGQVLDPAEAQARATWRAKIALIETPAEGCFHASYPNEFWENVACTYGPPLVHSRPPTVKKGEAYVVGDGDDYAAGVTGLIFSTVGSFPLVLGVKNEESVGVPAFGDGGILGPNEYTLQINSNFAAGSAACDGIPGCLVWQQFVYSTDYLNPGEAAIFMEYWLIFEDGQPPNYTCPSPAWYDIPPYYCVINSAYAVVPDLPITDLARESLSASAGAGRKDTVVLSDDRNSWSVSAPDSVVDLATVWNQSEFNVLGDAGGSEAVFNPNSLIWVNVAVSSGSFAAPRCLSNAGTTGETNNLNLGDCTALPGPSPSILFSESNIKQLSFKP